MSRYIRLLKDKQKLNAAFRALRKNGYIALQDFSCCGSCAWYEIGEMMEQPGAKQKAITYNSQSGDVFRDYEFAQYGDKLYIGFQGEQSEVRKAFEDAGLSDFHLSEGMIEVHLHE